MKSDTKKVTETVLFSFEGTALRNAPLAQLVEQLTLNQWALGSSPRWRTMARWSSG